jgi:hemin uptake protein HemP
MKPQQPSTTPQGAEPARSAGAGIEAARPPLVSSEHLLQGHRAIEISHNGVLYRLQATRLGKLILTK